MNKDKLTSMCHKISDKTDLSFNEVMVYYFLESILEKLSSSTYGDKFIFKGGFLLSNIVGLNTRSTVDIDFLIINSELSEENIKTILNAVLIDSCSKDISCEIRNIVPIKENDQYGGFRANILCKLENIRQNVPLDIATGDVITPHPIDYKFKSIFSSEDIEIKAYPIETILAEKIQTIYARGFFNSRSKDYYDLYILYRLKKDDIDNNTLKKALERTFKYRETELDYDKIITLLHKIVVDKDFLKRWKAYQKKNSYVQASFEKVIRSSVELLSELK